MLQNVNYFIIFYRIRLVDEEDINLDFKINYVINIKYYNHFYKFFLFRYFCFFSKYYLFVIEIFEKVS